MKLIKVCKDQYINVDYISEVEQYYDFKCCITMINGQHYYCDKETFDKILKYGKVEVQ